MSESLLIAAAVAVAATAAYWYLKFRFVLPLERKLAAGQRRSADSAALAVELLQAPVFPATPQSFADALQFAVDRFLARYPGAHLFVWLRMKPLAGFPAMEADLIARTGLLSALEPSQLAVSERDWSSAVSGEAVSVDLAGRRARLFGWGESERICGVLGVVEAEFEKTPGTDAAEALRILTAHFSACAREAGRFWELEHSRLHLEGGLSTAMTRLDQTNQQLIQRAKEMRTLSEITEAISSHPDHLGMLNSIVAIVAKSLEADLCAFLLLDENARELVTQPGAYGIAGDEGALYRISLSNEEASSVRVFKSGKPFSTGDAQNDPQVISHYARLWKCHSLMVVPLSVEGHTVGVMRVGSFNRNHFTADHLQFVRVIAEEAAVLVESAILSKELAQKNREMEKMQAMKDEFVSTVSHEFKTPLTSIKGFLAVLLEEEAGPLTAEQKRFLGIILSASERLGSLVSDMLDISRLEGGLDFEMAPVDFEQVARISVESHRWQAEGKRIRLILETPPLLPKVRGHEEWLRQVCDNLVSNALKFTKEGGQVTLSVANKGEALQVTVADDGIGIPPADQKRVFEKFFRASNRQEAKAPGTGLGLAIAKSIVDKHGGRIWLESEQGRGTKFHFIVPAAKEQAGAADESVGRGKEER